MVYDYLVLGAGVAGMGAAHALEAQGKTFQVIEAEDRAGGVLQSLPFGDTYVDLAANSIRLSDEFAAFIKHLGIADELVESSDLGKNRFLLQEKGIVKVSNNPISILTANWLGFSSKKAIIQEYFKPGIHVEEESVSDFISRRFSKEIAEKLVDPIMSGIYAGNIEDLESDTVLAAMKQAEKEHGSLLKALMKNPPKARKIVSFKKGFSTLSNAFEKQYAEYLQLNSSVENIRKVDEAFEVVVNREGKQEILKGKHILSSIPPYALKKVCDFFSGQYLDSIPYAEMYMTHVLAPKAYEQKVPQGFGVLVPSYVGKNIKGVLFNSLAFPKGSEHFHFTIFHAGKGSLQDEIKTFVPGLNLSDCELLEKAWKRAIPQFEIGYQHLKQKLVEACPKGFHLIGSYTGKVAVADVFKQTRRYL